MDDPGHPIQKVDPNKKHKIVLSLSQFGLMVFRQNYLVTKKFDINPTIVTKFKVEFHSIFYGPAKNRQGCVQARTTQELFY